MESKVKINLGDRLLDARNEGLKNMRENALRPHGKLWGMDVFSWYQPDVNLLSNTLHSFPFPVVWLGNSEDIKNTIAEDSSVCAQLTTIVSFDNSFFNISLESLDKIQNVVALNSLHDALLMLKAMRKKSAVLLFSASGESWFESKNEFEEFLNIHQTI
jgi:hypothetical protein